MPTCRSRYQAALAAIVGLCLTSASIAASPGPDDEWPLPAKNYEGNRFTGLTQITPANVGMLGLAWQTDIADDGQQEAAPIVHDGTMYVTTPHDNVLALDARTGKLKWQFPYNPAVVLFAVNRGAGIGDGKVVIATQDCRIIALDDKTGKPAWNVPGCRDTANSFYSMAAYIYKDTVIVGTGGGDNGNRGTVNAFRLSDGKRLWEWDTIKRDTWKGDSWKHGGADVWSGLSINPKTNTLFVAPGNPGPDLVLKGREGADLYSNSLVALDIGGSKPKVKWHYQLLRDDTHDADPAMIPVVFSARIDGKMRDLVAIGDKAGNFVVLDQTNGKVLQHLSLSDKTGLDAVPTLAGVRGCPNHGGGIEWLGGAYDPASGLFIVPSTKECGNWVLKTETPEYIPGQTYTGGPLPKRENGTGIVTAIDVATGTVKWTVDLPYPAQGGALITATGLVFTSDLSGTVYAFEAKTGKQLWKADTGSSICAPFSAFALDGEEYLAIMVGKAGNQQTANLPKPNGSHVLVYKIGATQPAVNTADGQVPLSIIPMAGSGTAVAGSGSAPYTAEQATKGQTVYATNCTVCHGDRLEGVSAPALTGSSFAQSHLTVSQLRGVVTTEMPLTAPGSLSPAEYADVIAYLLASDCVPPAGGGKVPFPTSDMPALAKVTIGGKTCLPSAEHAE